MHSTNRKWVAALVAVAGSGSVATIAFGDNWNNPAGGSWGLGTNWSNNVVPTSATFNLGSSGYTVTVPGGESVTSFVVQSDNPTLSLGGNTIQDNAGFPPGGQLQIAPSAGQTGSLTLNGPGTFSGGALGISVGAGGTGALIINGAKVMNQGDGASVSEGAGGSITVENGGQLIHQDDSNITLAGSLTVNDGTVESEGGLSLAGAMVSNGSTLTAIMGSVGISGAFSMDDSTLFAEVGAVGFSGGSLTLTDGANFESSANLKLPSTTNNSSSHIVGNVVTFSGTTTVQLGPTAPPFADYFAGGSGSFAGVFDITLQNGFVPTVGEQFKIFGFGGTSTGSFSAVNLPALPISDAWDTSQLFTTGVISVVPEPTGAAMLGLGGLRILQRRRRTRIGV